jgi:hypothetical protein
MQLYSVEQKRSQPLEAHSAAFSTLTIGGKETNVIVFTTKTFANGAMNSKVHCIALGGTHKKQAELFFPAEFADDFPVSLHVRCVILGSRQTAATSMALHPPCPVPNEMFSASLLLHLLHSSLLHLPIHCLLHNPRAQRTNQR